jgi:methylthioribulose-1-phosphate dehydratase
MSVFEFKSKLSETIRHYNAMGWSPATSTNYSFKDETNQIWVSRSGVDKFTFCADDFITVNREGEASGNFANCKPSAETLIHCVLYELFPETTVILHSHSVFPVLISTHVTNEFIVSGYEIQKGFSGQTTHEHEIAIPVFENTQDMNAFTRTLRENTKRMNHCSFIMRKHGTYAWGKDLAEAKKHIETLEYLCHCEWLKNSKI